MHFNIPLWRLKFSYSSDEESDETEISSVLYYENDPELPLYSTTSCGYQASDLANILMAGNMDHRRVCKADDLGNWHATGTKSTYFSLSPNGGVQIAAAKPSHSLKSSYYTLTRRY